MTKCFVRVERGGRWLNLEVDALTDAELAEYFRDTPREELVAWAVSLAGWIRDHVREPEVPK